MRTLPALVVAVLLVLTGCAGGGTDPGAGYAAGSVPSGAAEPNSDAGPPEGTGKTADLSFTGTTLEGDTFDGSSLAGKPAVLWFWAPWCPTCRAQSAAVERLAEEYAGEVAVVGVGALDDEDAVRGFAEQVTGVEQLVDPDGSIWQHFRVTAQSTYTVISADGEIISEGYLDDAELAELVARLA